VNIITNFPTFVLISMAGCSNKQSHRYFNDEKWKLHKQKVQKTLSCISELNFSNKFPRS